MLRFLLPTALNAKVQRKKTSRKSDKQRTSSTPEMNAVTSREQVKNLEIRDISFSTKLARGSFSFKRSCGFYGIIWISRERDGKEHCSATFVPLLHHLVEIRDIGLLREILSYRRFAIHFWSCQQYSQTIRIALND
jgi:hypothetical protein